MVASKQPFCPSIRTGQSVQIVAINCPMVLALPAGGIPPYTKCHCRFFFDALHFRSWSGVVLGGGNRMRDQSPIRAHIFSNISQKLIFKQSPEFSPEIDGVRFTCGLEIPEDIDVLLMYTRASYSVKTSLARNLTIFLCWRARRYTSLFYEVLKPIWNRYDYEPKASGDPKGSRHHMFDAIRRNKFCRR